MANTCFTCGTWMDDFRHHCPVCGDVPVHMLRPEALTAPSPAPKKMAASASPDGNASRSPLPRSA